MGSYCKVKAKNLITTKYDKNQRTLASLATLAWVRWSAFPGQRAPIFLPKTSWCGPFLQVDSWQHHIWSLKLKTCPPHWHSAKTLMQMSPHLHFTVATSSKVTPLASREAAAEEEMSAIFWLTPHPSQEASELLRMKKRKRILVAMQCIIIWKLLL